MSKAKNGLQNLLDESSKSQQKVSVQVVGEGSGFMQEIIPTLKKNTKVILSALALTGLSVFLFGEDAENKKEANPPTQTQQTENKASSIEKAKNSWLSTSEDKEKKQINEINKKNEQNGVVKHANGYRTAKDVGALKGIYDSENIKHPVFDSSSFVTKNNKEHLEKIAMFELDPSVKTNQISSLIAKHSFRKGNYYEALMVTGEGYVKTTADNKGSTIYHGINVMFQSKNTMSNMIKGVTQDKETIDKYTQLAGVKTVNQVNSTIGDKWLPVQKSLQMSVMLQETFDKGVVQQIQKHGEKNFGFKKDSEEGSKVLNNVEDHVQSAVRYMGYKLGGGNFGQYKSFMNDLTKYSKLEPSNRTQDMRDKLADKVSFKYTVAVMENGVEKKIIKEDVRATLLVQSMIRSPQEFGYLIREDVKPENFDRVAKKITGVDVKYDKADFDETKMPKSMDEEIKEMEKQYGKVTVDTKRGFFDAENTLRVQKEIEQEMAKPKPKTCGSASWSVSC